MSPTPTDYIWINETPIFPNNCFLKEFSFTVPPFNVIFVSLSCFLFMSMSLAIAFFLGLAYIVLQMSMKGL